MSFEDGEDGDCDGIDFKWMNDSNASTDEEDWNERDGGPLPKLNIHDLNLRGKWRRIILRNPNFRISIFIAYGSIKVISCILYIVRVCLDEPSQYACDGHPCNSTVPSTESGSGFTSTKINWYVILWVHRPMPLWGFQLVLSLATFVSTCLISAITAKGNMLQLIVHRFFLLEMVCSLPVLATVCYPPVLLHMFAPQFLNCWLALISMRRVLHDFHISRQRFQTMSVTLSQQTWFLVGTLACLIFTTICGIQHIQRGSEEKHLNMFEAVYFVIVTLSTVGYGDISPDIWLGQLFMLLMIGIAFAFIPRRLEEIASTWSQRKKMGGDYGKRASSRNKHVVVFSADFTMDSVMNFLSEFYEHPKLEHFTVVLVSSEELDNNMQFILKDPKWAYRVIYIRGSALKDIDLKRCRISTAEACFFLIKKNISDPERSDHHTVLRSWAVKDYAPGCAQYIQLYKAANKIHVKFAEHVVCEDEFKYALLANNCLYPGLSTLVTLILHTSRGHEGQWAPLPWQKAYGRHSGNEIYHIQVQKSIFFKSYEGKQFTFASADAHQRYGVNLIGVLDTMAQEPKLQLNPGSDYIMKGSDYCFYMSIAREECMKISPTVMAEGRKNSEARSKNTEMIVKEFHKWMKDYEDEEDEESVFSTITSSMGQSWARQLRAGMEGTPLLTMPNHPTLDVMIESLPQELVTQESFDRVQGATKPGKMVQLMLDSGSESFIIGSPPSTLNLGTHRTLCHLHKEARSLCCLEWGKPCAHCENKTAQDKSWQDQLIILSVHSSCPGLYNFIVPLRSNYLSLTSLSPIILMFEEVPKKFFLETIAHFPLVFWMQGSLKSTDDLLVAGIHRAVHLVISHIDSDPGDEENLQDAQTIITVQKISRLFPHVNIITEVNEASNMRFMHFKAKDASKREITKLEKRLKEKALSNLPYMFRLPFAAGQVFSSGMLDRLLYQTFVKGYLISFVRLLLGIDAEKDSGHLSSVRIRRATLTQFPTYGDLYQGLSSTTGEIPIAIYRTEKQNDFDESPLSNPDVFDTTMQPTAKKKRKSFRFSKFTHHGHQSHLQSSRMSVSAKFFSHDKLGTQNLEDMVQAKLESLNLDNEDESYSMMKPEKTISYVIVNPSPVRKLRNGDMVYVIQPSSMQAIPSKMFRSHRSSPPKAHGHRTRYTSMSGTTFTSNSSIGCSSGGTSVNGLIRHSLDNSGSESSPCDSPVPSLQSGNNNIKVSWKVNGEEKGNGEEKVNGEEKGKEEGEETKVEEQRGRFKVGKDQQDPLLKKVVCNERDETKDEKEKEKTGDETRVEETRGRFKIGKDRQNVPPKKVGWNVSEDE